MKIHENLKQLELENEQLANELLEEKGNGQWENESIIEHDSITDFAEYEVLEGWYSSLLNTNNIDFNGSPDLFEFIDYDSLGESLKSNWDESGHYHSDNTGKVLSTTIGW